MTLAAAIGAGVLAWRLAREPLELPWLVRQLQAQLNTDFAPARVTIQSAALAWEGFSQGLGSPLDFRVTGINLRTDKNPGPVEIPYARMTFGLLPLLAGRLEPRLVELYQPKIILRRSEGGAIRLSVAKGGQQGAEGDIPDPTVILNELGAPPGKAGSNLPLIRELSELRIHQADLSLINSFGVIWRSPNADLDLRRASAGGMEARANLTLRLGHHPTEIAGTASIPPGSTGAEATFRFSGLTPEDLPAIMPWLSFLNRANVEMSGAGHISLSPDLGVRHFTLQAQAKQGALQFGGTSLPFSSAELQLDGTRADVTLDQFRVALLPPGFSPPVTLSAAGTLQRGPVQSTASLKIDLDRVRFADLPGLWPQGLLDGARAWILENITEGTAHHGHFAVELSAGPGLNDLRVLQASGTLAGNGLSVFWLRPMPPAVDGQATLRVAGPGIVDIDISSARQLTEAPTAEPLNVRNGTVRISGLGEAVQTAAVDLKVSGTVPSLIGLLSDPRLNLLSRARIHFRDPEGQLDGSVSVSLPLLADLRMDQISVTADAHLSGLRLGGLPGGEDLAQGAFALSAGNDGMTLNGQGLLGGIPARVAASLDFRAGPATQVVRRIALSGEPDTDQLAGMGLDPAGVISGSLPITATVIEQRNAAGRVEAHIDLTRARLNLTSLGWDKPEGQAAGAELEILLDHDRVQRINSIRVHGHDLLVEGYASFLNGRISSLRADRLTLGQTKAQATVQFPTPTAPITATISGSSLDLSGRFAGRTAPGARRLSRIEPAPQRGPAWQADIRFDRVVLAHGLALLGLAAHAVDDGETLRDLRVSAVTGPHDPALMVIAPEGSGRSVHVVAADAGALLRALDLVETMDGGKLQIAGRYHDQDPGRPLIGTLELNDFRLRNAAVFGKLLQAATLYGLIDALKGPGVGFNKLVAPFRLADGRLSVEEARAFSPSLGLTAKGLIDLDAGVIDLHGTVVPIYFFNSLLGRMPLVGRLFSPEEGGGLIAASYGLKGSLANPAVTVNPLTALTPGFLRGVFGSR